MKAFVTEVNINMQSLKHLTVQMMLKPYLNSFVYSSCLTIVGILNGIMTEWDFNKKLRFFLFFIKMVKRNFGIVGGAFSVYRASEQNGK